MYLDIILQALHMRDLADHDLHQVIFRIHENIIAAVFSCGRRNRLIAEIELLQRFVAGLEETFEGNRFHEIIEHIEVEALEGESVVSRDKDDHWLFPAEALQELYACDPRHLYIEKNEIDIFLLQNLHGFIRVPASPHQLQKRDLADIVFQQVEGEALVIHSNTAQTRIHEF